MTQQEEQELKQEYFDKAVAGLASQGFRQSRSHQGCLYRGPNGTKCAIGWLIPDDKYETRFDDRDVFNCVVMDFEAVCGALGLDVVDKYFFRRLQKAHDFAHSPSDMKIRLRALAQREGLEIPAVLND